MHVRSSMYRHFPKVVASHEHGQSCCEVADVAALSSFQDKIRAYKDLNHKRLHLCNSLVCLEHVVLEMSAEPIYLLARHSISCSTFHVILRCSKFEVCTDRTHAEEICLGSIKVMRDLPRALGLNWGAPVCEQNLVSLEAPCSILTASGLSFAYHFWRSAVAHVSTHRSSFSRPGKDAVAAEEHV